MDKDEESFDLSQKARDLPTTIGSLDQCDDPQLVLQHVKKATEVLLLCSYLELKDILKHVIPVVIDALKQIYSKNNSLVETNSGQVLKDVKRNVQVAIDFIDISYQILENIMSNGTVLYNEIPDVSISLANIINSTFEYCKYSQETNSAFYKSVSEILELFRKTQEMHSQFLNFFNAFLTFDFSNEDEVVAYIEILDVILEIGKTLSGVNMKSMTDNWKSYIGLVQKISSSDVTLFELSRPIQVLIEEISDNLQTISKLDDPQKRVQYFKVTAFLVKVALKLFECPFSISKNFDSVFNFWISIYSWRGCVFQTCNAPEASVDSYNTILELCNESLVDLVLREGLILKEFFGLNEDHDLVGREKYGSLLFAVTLLKVLPKLSGVLEDFKLVCVVRLFLNLSKDCYSEFFFDDNSSFYEEVMASVGTAILLFPDKYPEVEKLLLQCVVGEKIWTTLIATDVWCFVLRHSSENTRRSVFTVLVNKLLELDLGPFHHSPAIIHLKILIQRIFQILPISVQIEELSKYDSNNIQIWKIISTRNIPMSHRYYIEFILCDLDDKMAAFEKKDHTSNDFIFLMENLDILSNTNFKHLEINKARLVPTLMKLWSFDTNKIPPENKFFNYFISKLAKVTTVVIEDLTAENLLFVLRQLKSALGDSTLELLCCDILQEVSKLNFNYFLKKNSLFSLISEMFKILLGSKDAIVVQMALSSFSRFSENENYGFVVQKVSNSSPFVKKLVGDYLQKSASGAKYDLKHFDNLRNYKFQHRCLNLRSDEPKCKKMKIEDDIDVIIKSLTNETEKLVSVANHTQVNSSQKADISSVIRKLEVLLN